MKHPATLALAATALLSGAALYTTEAGASPLPAKGTVQSSTTITTSRGRLGAQVISMSPSLRKFFSAPRNAGLLVDRVLPNTPAAKAGLRAGDVIVKTNGQVISQAWDISSALEQFKAGDKVEVEVVRNKRHQTLWATLDTTAGSSLGRLGLLGPLSNRRAGPQWDPNRLFGGPQNFPFSSMQALQPNASLQEAIQRLEARLDRLEGKQQTSRTTVKPPQKLQGPITIHGKQS